MLHATQTQTVTISTEEYRQLVQIKRAAQLLNIYEDFGTELYCNVCWGETTPQEYNAARKQFHKSLQ